MRGELISIEINSLKSTQQNSSKERTRKTNTVAVEVHCTNKQFCTKNIVDSVVVDEYTFTQTKEEIVEEGTR